jgi:Na+/H+-dicarboxylate symporter
VIFHYRSLSLQRHTVDNSLNNAMNNQNKSKKSISLATQIVIGLLLGVGTGLFFGEKIAPIAIVGRAYIGLIQMSILPYMVVSSILGIGSLSYDKATRLGE